MIRAFGWIVHWHMPIDVINCSLSRLCVCSDDLCRREDYVLDWAQRSCVSRSVLMRSSTIHMIEEDWAMVWTKQNEDVSLSTEEIDVGLYNLFVEEKFVLRMTEKTFETTQLMVFQLGSVFWTTRWPDKEHFEQRFSNEIEKNRTRTSLIGHFIGE